MAQTKKYIEDECPEGFAATVTELRELVKYWMNEWISNEVQWFETHGQTTDDLSPENKYIFSRIDKIQKILSEEEMEKLRSGSYAAWAEKAGMSQELVAHFVESGFTCTAVKDWFKSKKTGATAASGD